ncbi:hypothetical protein N7478_002172 [Penicillium angulare]|uniref:uncharacterized protein n=1 Tax=Penicillium angulare TaxID=116970 RepID=UPI0025410C9D|nr:uncharacterized protein N7478_002172 [Penicillium angulare]KAJ5289142.1 hypothetical protein N7478_002172 [Penicillium angulare]
MPTPHSQATHPAGILFSSTGDCKKHGNCEIAFEKQKPVTLQENALVQLDTMKIKPADTKYAALLLTNSSKASANSISRRRNEAGVNITKIQTRFDPPHVDIFSSKIKGKQNKRSHFGKPPDETSQFIALTASSPMDISLLSVCFRSSKTKRFRQTTSTLWKLPTSNEINAEFSDPKRIYHDPEARQISAPKQDLRSEQASSTQRTVAKYNEQLQAVANGAGEKLYHGHKKNSSPHNEMKREANQDAVSLAVLEPALSRQGLKEVGAVTKSLRKIIPLELIQHLGEDSRRCPAWTIQGKRCKRHLPIRSISAQLQSLAALKPNELLHATQDLIEVVFCDSHRKVAFKEIQVWKEEFQELSSIHDYESIFLVKNERLWALIRWVRLLERATLSQPSLSSFLQPTASKVVQVEPLMINPIQEFDPYISKSFSGTTSEELAILLTRPLGPSDLKYQGSMYIFWQRGNFGHLKIGRSGNVPCRLKQWNKQCKKTMEVFFPEPVKNSDEKISDLQQVPHVSRVEALVHLELIRFRKIEKKCPGCSKSHREWFEVPKDIAIGVVRKWSAWINTLPYEKQMKDGNEQWILRSEEKKNIDKLCRTGIYCSIPCLPAVKEKKRSRPRPRPRHSL